MRGDTGDIMATTRHGKIYGSAWRRMRQMILARDSFTCQYCMAPATTVDHVVPVSKGGEILNPENLVAACVSCNSRKQDKPTHLFLVTALNVPFGMMLSILWR